jgi:hypothetical protein
MLSEADLEIERLVLHDPILTIDATGHPETMGQSGRRRVRARLRSRMVEGPVDRVDQGSVVFPRAGQGLIVDEGCAPAGVDGSLCMCRCMWRARVEARQRRKLGLVSGLKGQERDRGDKCACVGLSMQCFSRLEVAWRTISFVKLSGYGIQR